MEAPTAHNAPRASTDPRRPETAVRSLRPASTLALLVLLGAAGCDDGPDASASGASSATSEAPRAIDPQALAGVVARRLAPESGERMLLVAEPGRFDPLVASLLAALDSAGAEVLGVRSVEGSGPASWATDFTAGLEGLAGTALTDALADVDVGLMLPGADPTDPVYGAYQAVLAGGHGRAVHFHWAGAYDLDGTERVIEPAVDLFYQAAVLETDYRALAAEMRSFQEALRAGPVRVETPEGTDLSFRVGDRPIILQDGDASPGRASEARTLVGREVELPAGAVRVAPLEESVEGVIAFPPTVWRGERVEGLRMTLEAGRVTSVEADTGLEAVLADLDEGGPEARSFRGFALGFNPLLEVPRTTFKWIPYYGYGAGVVRLSLGGNRDIGGAVEGDWVRWNFFTEARVAVNGVRWVDYGRFVAR